MKMWIRLASGQCGRADISVQIGHVFLALLLSDKLL